MSEECDILSSVHTDKVQSVEKNAKYAAYLAGEAQDHGPKSDKSSKKLLAELVMADEAKKESTGAPKVGMGAKIAKLLPVIFIVVNLAVSGAGIYFVFLSTVGWKYPVMTEEQEAEALPHEREKRDNSPIMYTLDKFTVNLDGTPKRFIQTEISLEMLDEKGFEEVVTLGAQARDAIVRLLNAKTFTDIETIQGKLFLKDQIAMTLNQLLKKGVVRGVYFSDFLVQ